MDKNPYTIEDMIKVLIRNIFSNFHTALPGKVKDFNPDNQTATIQPLIKKVMADGKDVDLPFLYDVPVIMPKCGGFYITFPVKEGEECLLLVCERSIVNWLNSGEISKPAHYEMGSYTDAVALIGFGCNANRIADYDNSQLVIRSADNKTRIELSNTQINIMGAEQVNIGENTIIDQRIFMKHRHQCDGQLKDSENKNCSGTIGGVV